MKKSHRRNQTIKVDTAPEYLDCGALIRLKQGILDHMSVTALYRRASWSINISRDRFLTNLHHFLKNFDCINTKKDTSLKDLIKNRGCHRPISEQRAGFRLDKILKLLMGSEKGVGSYKFYFYILFFRALFFVCLFSYHFLLHCNFMLVINKFIYLCIHSFKIDQNSMTIGAVIINLAPYLLAVFGNRSTKTF